MYLVVAWTGNPESQLHYLYTCSSKKRKESHFHHIFPSFPKWTYLEKDLRVTFVFLCKWMTHLTHACFCFVLNKSCMIDGSQMSFWQEKSSLIWSLKPSCATKSSSSPSFMHEHHLIPLQCYIAAVNAGHGLMICHDFFFFLLSATEDEKPSAVESWGKRFANDLCQ